MQFKTRRSNLLYAHSLSKTEASVQLKYRGISYTPRKALIPIPRCAIAGQYRGVSTHLALSTPSTGLRTSHKLTYRGVSYILPKEL